MLILTILSKSTYGVPVDSLAGKFAKQIHSQSSDVIYLQTSKDIYETGEDLWFKAYQLNAQTFGLSARSKTLYLQLLNNSDSIAWQEKYPIENGIAEGHVYIDNTLSPGDYFLEAYSSYSFNADTTQVLSSRKIRIEQNISHFSYIADSTRNNLRFCTFPEGGQLVYGTPSRLAFKATDSKGNPVSVLGALYQNGVLLNEIESIHDGMGSVYFTPLVNNTYVIRLTDGQEFPLLNISDVGMTLRYEKQGNGYLEFVVSQNKRKQVPFYLLGHMRGSVRCVAKGKLKDSLRVRIPITEFARQGIAEFTLFDGNLQPVAERLVYVYPDKKLNITVETDKKRYEIREKATVTLKVTDEEGNPVKAHLGASVFDQAYKDDTNPVNILTYCYLSAVLRGKIHNPAYYFNTENQNRNEALDLLLLTQGWRRFVWDENERDSVDIKPILTDEITGVQTIKNKKMKGADQFIQVLGAEGNSDLMWMDSTGYFSVSVAQQQALRGGYIYLKPMLSPNFGPKLKIDDMFPVINDTRKSKDRRYPYIDLSQVKRHDAFDIKTISRDSTILLDEVVISRKAKKPFRDKFMGRLDSLAQVNLEPWVCEHSPGYLEDYREGYTHHPHGNYAGKRIAPVAGKNYRLIKYARTNSGTYYVEEVSNVMYNSYESSEKELLRMNNLWRTKGYYAAREFYQPDEIDMLSSVPDARNTLYWNPSVVTDENGEAAITFYCSDINTKFTGRIEGVDGVGLLGTVEFEFRVLRNTP